jgi:hypothetical protein
MILLDTMGTANEGKMKKVYHQPSSLTIQKSNEFVDHTFAVQCVSLLSHSHENTKLISFGFVHQLNE